MKNSIIMMAAACTSVAGCAAAPAETPAEGSAVYMTTDISPEGLVRVYEALGVKASGRVAVKISTGEPGGHNYLKPELIGQLVKKVGGTIVECNTAYPGKRYSTEDHIQAIRDHGFYDIAEVDIMDSEGEIRLPVRDGKHLQYDLVGDHIKNYDFMINLAHFKGHAMGGFGGVLKNQSIGVASSAGKAYIHTAGKTEDQVKMWDCFAEQDDFLESMAEAAQAVADNFGKNIVYINVMNNMSIDCDCDAHPADPLLKDIGILASTDPVALDKACLDLVFNVVPGEGNDNGPLVERIKSLHGTYIVDYAERIGMGSKTYHIVSLDESPQKAE